jgi:hypothetical protein
MFGPNLMRILSAGSPGMNLGITKFKVKAKKRVIAKKNSLFTTYFKTFTTIPRERFKKATHPPRMRREELQKLT